MNNIEKLRRLANRVENELEGTHKSDVAKEMRHLADAMESGRKHNELPKMNPADKRQAIDDLKKLHGLPPYDGGENMVRGDGYFANSLASKYNMDIATLEKASGFSEVKEEWNRHRSKFIGK